MVGAVAGGVHGEAYKRGVLDESASLESEKYT